MDGLSKARKRIKEIKNIINVKIEESNKYKKIKK